MHISIRRRAAACVLTVALFALLLQLQPATAEEPDDAALYEVGLFDVGALTAGRNAYFGEQQPPVGPDDVSDEGHPLFGAIAEEPEYPFGQVDELMDLLRMLSGPDNWKDPTDGAFMLAQGEYAILVKHRPSVLAGVARALADLERRALATVTVEVRAVHASSLEQVDPATAAAAVPDAAKDPGGPALLLTGFLGQRISGFSGSQFAYVQDYDVEVSKGATAADPIVGVANLGLRADVRVVAAADGRRLQINVRAWHAALADRRDVSTGAHRLVETPAFDVTSIGSVVEAQPGVWTAVSGGGGERGWSFFVRATSGAWVAAAASPLLLRIPAPSGAPHIQALHDVRDLDMLPPMRRGGSNFLVPSNYTPPEPPAYPEPASALEVHELIGLLKNASPADTWPSSALQQVGPGMLYVRHAPNVLAGLAAALEGLRKQRLVSLRARADLVEVPAGLLESLRGAAGAGGAALERALKDGSARRLDRLDLVSRVGTRNAITAGRFVTYLADYEVEIADEADIANPVIQQFLDGAALEMAGHLTADGKGVALDVQFGRTEPTRPMRRVEVPAGSVTVPELGMLRVRTGVVAPFGQTVLLGADGDGPTRRVLLLTTTLDRGP